MRITWSYRKRGMVQRTQTKKNRKKHSLRKNVATPMSEATQPSPTVGIHGSTCQPPRNIRMNSVEPMIMWLYSATKKMPNLKAPYSVWKPPTRSVSDSGMSNGWRFVSANTQIRKTSAATGWQRMFQAPLWASTIARRLRPWSWPGTEVARKIVSTDRPIASS